MMNIRVDQTVRSIWLENNGLMENDKGMIAEMAMKGAC